MWHKHRRLSQLIPFLLLVIFIEATDGFPLGTASTVPQRNPIFRFTIYKRGNVTNFPTIFKQHKSFGIKYDFYEINNIFTPRPNQEPFSTLMSDDNKQKLDIEKEKLKYNIDEDVLFQIFKDDYNTGNKTTTTTSDIDFTTEDSTTLENYTDEDGLDDRFGSGGLTSQHAIASLIGG